MDNYTIKVKEILKGLDAEIEQYEKAILDAEEHVKFMSGHIAGLRRARTTLEIFFQTDLNKEA